MVTSRAGHRRIPAISSPEGGWEVTVTRQRPEKEALPPRYEVAEILNLQAVRDEARRKMVRGEGRRKKDEE